MLDTAKEATTASSRIYRRLPLNRRRHLPVEGWIGARSASVSHFELDLLSRKRHDQPGDLRTSGLQLQRPFERARLLRSHETHLDPPFVSWVNLDERRRKPWHVRRDIGDGDGVGAEVLHDDRRNRPPVRRGTTAGRCSDGGVTANNGRTKPLTGRNARGCRGCEVSTMTYRQSGRRAPGWRW